MRRTAPALAALALLPALSLLTACGQTASHPATLKTLSSADLQKDLPVQADVPAGFTISAGATAAPATPTGLAACDYQQLLADLPQEPTGYASNGILGTTIRYAVTLEQSTPALATASLNSLVALGKACPTLQTPGQDGVATPYALVITDGVLGGNRALTLAINSGSADFYARIVDIDGVVLDAENATQKQTPDHASLDNLASALAGRVQSAQKG